MRYMSITHFRAKVQVCVITQNHRFCLQIAYIQYAQLVAQHIARSLCVIAKAKAS